LGPMPKNPGEATNCCCESVFMFAPNGSGTPSRQAQILTARALPITKFSATRRPRNFGTVVAEGRYSAAT
jgi:hypothetical protein